MDKKENQRPKSQTMKLSSTTPSVMSNSSSSGNNNNNRSQSTQRTSPARERFQSLLLATRNQNGSGWVGNGNNVRPSMLLSGQGSTRSSSKHAVVPFRGANPYINNYPNIDPRTFPRPMSHMVPSSSRPNFATKSMVGVGVERSRNLRAFVEKAMAEHKVFSCVGVYPAIKNALKKRGWVEKSGPISIVRSANISSFRDVTPDDESDQAWVTRNLRDYPPDFIWVIRRDNIDWKGMHKDQIINRYPKAWFTTKVGLTACLQNMHWYSEAGFSETFFPRCYRLCLEDERQAFEEDYRLTACMSYLRYFCESFETKGPGAMIDAQSKITPLSIDFASRQLGNYIRMRRHEDIDWLLPPNFMSQHWEAFLHQYHLVLHDHRKIRFDNQESVKIKYDMAKKTLSRIGQFWPQAHLDGVFNMWICKPGARSRGKGIVIMNTLEKIMDLLTQNNYREANWVVQKYMERPLLVYKTKFDIRQWFVITDWSPLTLWFYKESYIRFCTKPFVLEDFHESIHLCNNAIQCRYQNAETRDSALPDENMWDCYTFQAYLKTIGKLDFWPKIYEGMKKAIIGVLLASQENVEPKKGAFELYGADFMLSEDFNPWLIEINSCPCMAASTSVTARMCSQCLEDTIKVVVDRKANKNADTGMFELAYRQPVGAVQVQQFSGHDLIVHGKKLTRDIDWPSMMINKSAMSSANHSKRASVSSSSHIVRQPTMLPPPMENLTFADLLQKLRMKNTAMFQGFVSNGKAQTLVAVSNPSDRSLTGTLLNKMRSLSKSQQETKQKMIHPSKSITNSRERKSTALKSDQTRTQPLPASNNETSLSYLTKYSENNTNTFANLVRIGNSLADELETENQAGSSVQKKDRQSSPKNPYLPTAETARTLDQVRAAVNAASEKYGKIDIENEFSLDYFSQNDISRIVVALNSIQDFSSSIPLGNNNNSSSQFSSLESLNIEENLNLDMLYELHSRKPKEASTSTDFERAEEHETKSRSDSSQIPSPIESNQATSTSTTPSTVDIPLIPEPIHTTTTNPSPPDPEQHDDDDDNNEKDDDENQSPKIESPSTVSINLMEFRTPQNSRPATANQNNSTENFINSNGNSNLVEDILNNNLPFPSSTSSSSESDFSETVDLFTNLNFIPVSSSSLLRTTRPVNVALKSARAHHHRHSIPNKSKLPLCHRISLKPASSSLKPISSRRSGPTFPLKKINLKLS